MTGQQLIELIGSFDEVCYSGGAAGADRLFGLYANSVGIPAIHFSFDRHKLYVPESESISVPQNLLTSPDIIAKLKKANQSLGRSIPKPGTYVYNLLARNSYQVVCTERVYAIGTMVSPTQVDGGTAWAVQMYMDANEVREIYVYDRVRGTLFTFDNNIGEFVETETVPAPHGKWTGIGSRSATELDMQIMETKFI